MATVVRVPFAGSLMITLSKDGMSKEEAIDMAINQADYELLLTAKESDNVMDIELEEHVLQSKLVDGRFNYLPLREAEVDIV